MLAMKNNTREGRNMTPGFNRPKDHKVQTQSFKQDSSKSKDVVSLLRNFKGKNGTSIEATEGNRFKRSTSQQSNGAEKFMELLERCCSPVCTQEEVEEHLWELGIYYYVCLGIQS